MENFFVNGRYIKSALLSRATEEAYKNELMVGKFPACVLNITLPPENVDINIHPTKLEAKFAEEKHIYHCVYWAVKNALYQSNFVPQVQEHKNIKPQFVRPQSQAEERSMQEQTAPQVKTNLPKEPTATLKETGGFTPTHTTKVMPPCSSNEPPALENRQEAFKLPAQKPIIKPAPEAAASTEQSLPTAEQTPVVPESGAPVYKICGQVFATYIIVEKDGKMLMVDQHAAHERLRYEKLLQQYRGREISSQLLLCPEVLTLTATEFAAFVENQEAICDLGFLADEFGQKQIIVRGTPAEAGECDVKATMLEVIEMLSGSRKYVDDDLAAKMLYRIACRGAVKANAVLNHAEMTKLLDGVFSLTGINTCPHGRPITVEFTKEFIEKQFKRIV